MKLKGIQLSFIYEKDMSPVALLLTRLNFHPSVNE